MAVERATFMQKLRHGLGHMMNRRLSAGLAGWREAIAPLDDHMSKALLHFLNRELSRGWHAWHAMWEVLKAKRESMRKSLGHLLHRELSRGWGSVARDGGRARAAFMQKLRHGLGHMMNRKLSSGLCLAGARRSLRATDPCRRRCCTS